MKSEVSLSTAQRSPLFKMATLVVYFLALSSFAMHITGFDVCENSGIRSENVNGNITFSPSATVLVGSNVTICCNGINGRPKPMQRPNSNRITQINIFRDSKNIRSCSGVPKCHYSHISQTKDRGNFTYQCLFKATLGMYTCTSSKKTLIVTDNECTLSPSPCHQNATCVKTNSSFLCKCNTGFTGDGRICAGSPPTQKLCTLNSSCSTEFDHNNCKPMKQSTQHCHCQENYIGNGTHCEAIPKTGSRASESDSQTIAIIVGVVIAVIFLVIFAVSVSFYQKRKLIRAETFNKAVHELNKGRTKSKHNLEIINSEYNKAVDSSPRRKLPSIREHNSFEEEPEGDDLISYICVLDDWEINRDDLTILDKKLGGGCFGVVKKGLYEEKENDIDKLTVAVKMLKDAPSTADRSDLLMELYILKEVNKSPHPNVIKLIGAFTSEEPILVITEFCARGNLRSLLRKSRMPAKQNEKQISTEYANVFSTLNHIKLVQIAVDIASGMQHLAANQFVHRDLSARNILIGADFEAKVSDFGLARPITGVDQMYVKSNRNLLPVKWMAVESLTRGVFRTSSDVWAFGVVLWEIATLGEEPYPGIDAFETFTLVASGKRMERPLQCSEELYNLMKKCWEHEHENRPSFDDIHGQMKEMLAESQHRSYVNVIEQCEDDNNASTEDRRMSVESLDFSRYTKGV